MIITIEEFLQAVPEFNNLDTYPQSRINFWLEYASLLVNEQRWQSLTKFGIIFLAAHQLYIANLEGQIKGPITSKSVDGVSASYDTNFLTANWGLFATSTYGIQFQQLAHMVGAGPIMAY